MYVLYMHKTVNLKLFKLVLKANFGTLEVLVYLDG